jgi:anti-sigma regulatory factor (Ser/Thr protein kinase)
MAAILVELPGGTGAPQLARRTVLGRLDGHVNAVTASDASLIISELVTNCVLHAGVGSDQMLTVGLEMSPGRMRITVTNPGADHQPHLRPWDPASPGGFGLRLLEEMCDGWGLVSEALATTGVWCDLAV